MLWRDDDINKYTDMTMMWKIHSLFIKYNKLHTVAVEMEDIWDAKAVWWWLMTAPNLEIGLHGWTHKDYSVMSVDDIVSDIKRSQEYWITRLERGGYNRKFFSKFYPPWNRVSKNLTDACSICGLQVDNRVGGEVFNFHWWTLYDGREFADLEGRLSG